MAFISARDAGVALVLLLCAVPLLAAADPADEELEATMEVLDDLSDVADSESKRRKTSEDEAAIRYDVFGERIGPAEGEENPDAENAADAASDSPGPRDEFEHDDIDEADRQHELETEHDFEDGEEVDYDEADEP